MDDRLNAWRTLIGGGHAELLERIDGELHRDGVPTASQITSWRKAADRFIVDAALDLVRARRASGHKFRRANPFMDVSGGEQASGWQVAQHKAIRFVAVDEPMIDLCCGVGADAAEFVTAGLNVTAVDRDPSRVLMCGANAECETVVADVVGFDVIDRLVHVDPGRRVEDRSGERRRRFDLEQMEPPIDDICCIVRATRGAGVKLSPAVDAQRLRSLHDESSVEYISLGGSLVQGVWWTGVCRDETEVRATVIDSSGSVTWTLASDAIPVHAGAPLGAYVYEPDAVFERAGLLGVFADRVGLDVVHPALGLLTGDATDLEAPMARFRVLEEMPFRRARVRACIEAHDGGIVEVKTRGGACDPDIEQRALRGSGARRLTVFVLRFGEKVRAIVSERC